MDDLHKVHLIRSLMNEYESKFIQFVLMTKLNLDPDELQQMRNKFFSHCPEIIPDDDPLTKEALEFLQIDKRPGLCSCCVKKPTKHKPKPKK